MTSFYQIGRLQIAPPEDWSEQVGDPVTNLGGGTVPNTRTALKHAAVLMTLAPDGATDTVAARELIRRQLRSMLNNGPLKFQGYLYVQYSDDPEQNGWYIPDQTQLVSGNGDASGLATGWWNVDNANHFLAGHLRTGKEARNIWMKNLVLGLNWRDTLKLIFSTDFSGLTPIQLSYLPSGATTARNTVSRQVASLISMPTGRDGGVAKLAVGISDLATISFERPESSIGLSDVIVYDMQGRTVANYITNPSFEQDTPSAAPATWVATGAPLSSGATITAVTAQHQFGAQAMQVVTTNANSDEGAMIASASTPAGSMTLSMYLKGNAGGENVKLFAGGTTQNVTLTNAWAQYSVTFTSAGGAVNVGVRTQAASVYTFFVDGVMLSTSTSLTYADGDQAGYIYSGASNASTTVGPGCEVYGADFPWSWVGAGPTGGSTISEDCPVIDNGLVRVRYDSTTNIRGFRVDVWNGSTYVEQGKMIFFRVGDSSNYDNTFVSAGIHLDEGWTPDRATIKVVLSAAGDAFSAEEIFITVQRGELSVTFEAYPAPVAAGTNADVLLQWTPSLTLGTTPDLNQSVFKNDSASAATSAGSCANDATAGTGAGTGHSGLYPGTQTIGNANFTTSENWATILRCSTAYNVLNPYSTTLVVMQAANNYIQANGSDNSAYNVVTDTYYIYSQHGAGYNQVQVGFASTVADQVMEAESMSLGAGTTSGGDASASGAATTQATRTTDANSHLTRGNWPNSFSGQFRVFARVKTTATQGSFYAKTGSTTGSTVHVTGAATPTYAWIDLGEVVAAVSTLEIHAWISSGSGIVEVDRIEAFLTQDRTRTSAIYSGCRDQGAAALYDARAKGAVVSR